MLNQQQGPSPVPEQYKGTLKGFKEVKGKERTVYCKYSDAMNDGDYTISFSKDYKQLDGHYNVDQEGESDANTVSAKKK